MMINNFVIPPILMMILSFLLAKIDFKPLKIFSVNNNLIEKMFSVAKYLSHLYSILIR